MKKVPFARVLLCSLVSACSVIAPSAASAYSFPRPLREGDIGKDVRAFQVRIAGWYPAPRDHHRIDGVFGPSTAEAVVAFETFHGLAADGVANEEVYEVLDSLTDGDGSTAHFDFDEFTQNTNQACSAKANAYAGTFGGGGRPQAGPLQREASEVAPRGGEGQSRKQARRHRLGVPKHPLQRLHRGARASQHLYGTAADNRIAEMTNHGPGGWHATARSTGSAATPSSPTTTSICGWTTYDLPSSQYWWWPERDDAGRELDQAGLPCWGERTRSQPAAPAGPLAAIVGAVPGASSLVPSIGDIGAFEVAGEVPNLGPAD